MKPPRLFYQRFFSFWGSLLCAVLLHSSVAHAYICGAVGGATSGGASFAWFVRQVTYAYNAQGTAQLSMTQMQGAVDAAFQTWQTLQIRNGLNCPSVTTNMTLISAGLTAQDFVGYNFLAPQINQNVILFQDNVWPYTAGSGDIVARTTLTYNDISGEIIDADIEFNTANFTFSVGGDANNTAALDLQTVATHEVGHLLGFAHSLDTTAVMAPPTTSTNLIHRQLACDDAAIMNFRYPAGTESVGYCDPNTSAPLCGYCTAPGVLQFLPQIMTQASDDGQGGGCQAAQQATPWGSLLILLGAYGVVRFKRRQDQAA